MYNSPALARFYKQVDRPVFGRIYMAACLVILFATTIFWTVLGAHLQSGNADQIVNPYLFENSSIFHGALWPQAHSFLIKWPVFWLVKVFGYSPASYTFFTLALTLLTIGVFVSLLFRIERRPMVFGTICLGLASVLLLVPIQPYAGAILPVNMAMIATRNIEYVVYVVCLVLLTQNLRFKSRTFWLAIWILAFLIASDRLFLVLSAGGALLALIFYAINSGWNLVSISVRWLIGSVIATFGAILILWSLGASHITKITNMNGAGPYGLVHSAHDIALGALYGLLGVLTNFGADPAFDSNTIRAIPHDAAHHLAGIGGFSYALNLLIFIVGLLGAWRLVKFSLSYNKNKKIIFTDSARLALMLTWTSIAAIIIFIFTTHYYAVDARYLTICLFAIFTVLAVNSRQKSWELKSTFNIGLIILISIGLGIVANYKNYQTQQTALGPTNDRNTIVADVLKQHSVNYLVGDYWRVMPIKSKSVKTLKVVPLANCTTLRDTLTSTSWEADLNKHSFAYLLTLDRGLTDYPMCTLDQVIAIYGRPSSSIVVAGKLPHPSEILLFYDSGANKSAPKIKTKTPGTILPLQLNELPNTVCASATTMNIVAHQDDDLLFINPDLIHDIKAGYCVRTVYVTAGDAGAGQFYWLLREQGSEAAYSQMMGTNNIWVNRIVQLGKNEFANIANPKGNNKISLVFMHLPDGSPQGTGFRQTGFESLARLANHQIPAIQTVDAQSVYTSQQLIDGLAALMQTYNPAIIRTQSEYPGHMFHDHSDHNTVGEFVTQAHAQYDAKQFANNVTVPLIYYLGYSGHEQPANVGGQDLTEKSAAFYAYAAFDKGVCASDSECNHTAYQFYLPRMYKSQ